MSAIVTTDLTELIDGEEFAGRASTPPERANRRTGRQRVRRRARRSRSNDMAKRGMHQRRNKRSAW
jgi:hypothetical protein